MQCCITTEPQQGATYLDQLGLARAAEDLGFDGYFRSDHFVRTQGVGGQESGLPGPTDAWTTLAGLARDTTSIRLGTLVTSATFRFPGVLAIIVAQVDQMSGGRAELGLGTGWNGDEHQRYGVPFPPTSIRFEKFAEQLEIIVGLWQTPVDKRYSFEGEHYAIRESPALPKPVQVPHPPIIIGGAGRTKTPHIAACWADEFNLYGSLDGCKQQFGRVRTACERIGRDPATLKFSVSQLTICGKNEAELDRRAAALGRMHAQVVGKDVRPRPGDAELVGQPAEIVGQLLEFRAIGVERVYFQILDYTDIDHLRLIADEVVPYVR